MMSQTILVAKAPLFPLPFSHAVYAGDFDMGGYWVEIDVIAFAPSKRV